MKGYEIFKKIWDETKGGARFKDHPLAKIEFKENIREVEGNDK